MLEIGPVSQEAKGQRRGGIKLSWIGDDVTEILVQKYVVRLDSKLKFVPAAIDGCDAFEISFTKKVVLKDFDGSRFCVGVEIVRIVANHRAKISDRLGRKSVLVGGASHRLNVVGSLALARGLLHLFVRNVVARELMANDKAQTILRRQVPLVIGRKISQRTGIREVLRNHRI